MAEIKITTYEQDRLYFFVDQVNLAQKKYNRLFKTFKDAPYLSEGSQFLSDAGRELQFYKDVVEMLDKGCRKQEWVSVDDRLPEIAGKYLISRKTVYGNLINIVWYDTNYNGGNDDMKGKSVWYMFDSDWGDYEIPDVTHWMPLPQPPKMKGGAE